MHPDILIVGQGLAGTLLGWELERAGIRFSIADRGHAVAASVVAAGLVNPITGRRLVKSWRFEQFAPLAEASFRAIGEILGVPLWRPMRLRRIFADDRERAVGADERRREDLAPFIESADESGWWIRGAARVDLPALLTLSRRRWEAAGVLRDQAVEIARESKRHQLVIDCRGVEAARDPLYRFVPWEFSKGELLEVNLGGLEPDVVLNRRFWIVPIREGAALAGATHETGVTDRETSKSGRDAIEAAVRAMIGPGRSYAVVDQRAGVRVNLPDRHPLAGRHPEVSRLGLVNGLGAKGALWAPALARAWVRHVANGEAFDSKIDVGRFGETAA